MNFKIIQETSPSPRDVAEAPTELYIPIKLPRSMELTAREVQALRYMAAGYTSDQIARELYISKETVDSHRKNIIKKLRVANVTAAVAFALRHHLIS
jgi:DNA-binding CsgD family transcriptional regulator